MAKLNFSKFAEKAKELVDKNGDKIASSVDKVTDKIDERTKGKYRDKLQKVDDLSAKLDKTGAAARTSGDDEVAQAQAAEADAATRPSAEAPLEPDMPIELLSPSPSEPAPGPDSFPEPS
jgi:hypothetical protein